MTILRVEEILLWLRFVKKTDIREPNGPVHSSTGPCSQRHCPDRCVCGGLSQRTGRPDSHADTPGADGKRTSVSYHGNILKGLITSPSPPSAPRPLRVGPHRRSDDTPTPGFTTVTAVATRVQQVSSAVSCDQ